MTENKILIRKLNKVSLDSLLLGRLDRSVVATFNLNLQSLGYTCSPELLVALRYVSPKESTSFFNLIFDILKELKGVHNYQPMYPNFPQQVLDMEESELYLNAITHYFTAWVSDLTGKDCIWLPKYTKNVRKPLDEKVELTVLKLAVDADLFKLSQNLAESNTSLSESDKTDLVWLIENKFYNFTNIIPNKENLAVISSVLVKNDEYFTNRKSEIKKPFNTATDVLRLAVALCDGDVSLAQPTKFKSIKRKYRKFLLFLLETINDSTRLEDMNRWKLRWIRLAEVLHPGELKNEFPKSFDVFSILRENLHVETFNSKVELNIKNLEIKKVADLLVDRPGEFARRLDHLLRSTKTKEVSVYILNKFTSVVSQVSTPVLLQVSSHFVNRNNKSDFRVVFPKGNTAKVQVLDPVDIKISTSVVNTVENICSTELLNRFSNLPSLGKVYLDIELENYLVPFSQRSASASLRTLVRGSKLSFDDSKNTLRFFIWWKDQIDKDSWSNRVDIDLSAVIYNSDWKLMEQIAYFNLKNNKYQAAHSGDITSGGTEGACEFIDINIPSLVKYGGRYVVMMVNSFTRQSFNTVPECSAGWMLRKEQKSGEIFDPRTVVDKLNLTADSKQAMPLIIDLVERKIIWTDASLKTNYGYVNNVAGNSDTISLIGKAMTNINKPTLYDLLWYHMSSRATMVVDTPEEADTVFSATTTPYQLEIIASKYLVDRPKENNNLSNSV